MNPGLRDEGGERNGPAMNAIRNVSRAALIVFLGFASALAQDSVFQDNDSLDTIREKIERNGYAFTVGHNWVFDMTPEQKKAFFSRRPSAWPRLSRVSDTIGPLAEHLGKMALPTSFDWRSYNGHSYIGAVRNQGDCGSCYSFGASAAAEVAYNFANGLFDANAVDFSESFIIWCLARLSSYGDHFYGCDGADYEYSELDALVQEGTILESAFPYRTSDPGSCAHYGDPRVTFAGWHRIECNNINAIKTAIMTYGAVDVAVYAGDDFQAYSGGIYEDGNKTCSGTPTCAYADTNHAVALVGWNDAEGVWILRNSWGASWGENGYMRIKYTSARVACAATYLVYDAAPGITVNAPAAGASWPTGTIHTIAWSKVGSQDATVFIELFKGGAKALDITTSTANDGVFDWAIPSGLAAGSDYVVRVTTSDNAYADDSGAFSIVVTPTITVTSPAAGTTWTRGTRHSILWTKVGSQAAKVKILLLRDGVVKKTLVASTPNDGSFDWKVGTGLARRGGYQIRVKTLKGNIKGVSGVFTID